MSDNDQPRTSKRSPIWQCTIGITGGPIDLPDGCDLPMRMAVREAFERITGRPAEFVFSGWDKQLDETTSAAVQKMKLDQDAYVRTLENFDLRTDPSPMHISVFGGSLCGIPKTELTRHHDWGSVVEERLFIPDMCAHCLSTWQMSRDARDAEAASHPAAPEASSPDGSAPAGGEPK